MLGGKLDGVQPPRGVFRLLRDRLFGPFLVAKLFESIGIWVHTVADAIVVYTATESALVVERSP